MPAEIRVHALPIKLSAGKALSGCAATGKADSAENRDDDEVTMIHVVDSIDGKNAEAFTGLRPPFA
jgi:hypothetical protein